MKLRRNMNKQNGHVSPLNIGEANDKSICKKLKRSDAMDQTNS